MLDSELPWCYFDYAYVISVLFDYLFLLPSALYIHSKNDWKFNIHISLKSLISHSFFIDLTTLSQTFEAI